MPVAELYRRQAALLFSVVPFVAVEKSLALKGGTAINLFVRDLPRISVDLDLAYLPVADRDTSLTAIDAVAAAINEAGPLAQWPEACRWRRWYNH
jgi:predicted nucleotidyltransferase component of viral defense system